MLVIIVAEILILCENQKLEIQQLLKDFTDITPQDLSKELPPLQSIQHQIDLISNANFHNLPHYHLTPKEHQIWHPIVVDLL